MLPAQSNLMYFTDLFAEIDTSQPQIPAASTPQFDAGATLTEAASSPLGPLLKTEDFSFVDAGEDAEDAEVESSSPLLAAAKNESPSPAAAAASSSAGAGSSGSPPALVADKPVGKRRKQELHRRHSKRYRDNLGELFHELELILPQVVPGCKLKTKSQIIASSVSAVRQLKLDVSTLEMRYVMSSAGNRARWVDDVVSKAASLQDAVEPFMRLLLGLQSWKHSELWMRAGPAGPGTFALRLDRVTSAAAASGADAFVEFVEGSQVMTFAAGDDSMVGRIATTLSPEWVDLKDPASLRSFKRGELALKCGLIVCFAVPFLIRGHVAAVVMFYDNQPRVDTQQRISVAQDLASAIGNCYGSLASKKERTG